MGSPGRGWQSAVNVPDLSALVPGRRRGRPSAICGGFSGACRTLCELGVDAVWISPIFPSPKGRTSATTSPTTPRSIRSSAPLPDLDALLAAAPWRAASGSCSTWWRNHTSEPARVVPGEPRLPGGGVRAATGTSGGDPAPGRRPAQQTGRSAFGGRRVGSWNPRHWPVLLPRLPWPAQARSQLAQPGGARRDARGHALLAEAGGGRLSGWT